MELSGQIGYFVYFDKSDFPYSPIIPSEIITGPLFGCFRFLPKNLMQIKQPLKYFGLITSGEYLTNNRLYMTSTFPSGFEANFLFDVGVILWNKEELPPTNIKSLFSMPIVFRDIYPPRKNLRSMGDFIISIIKEIEIIVIPRFLES